MCCVSDCFCSFCSRTVTEVRKLTPPELLQVLEGPSTCGDLQRVFARALRDGVEGWMLGVIQNLFKVGEKHRMNRDSMTCWMNSLWAKSDMLWKACTILYLRPRIDTARLHNTMLPSCLVLTQGDHERQSGHQLRQGRGQAFLCLRQQRRGHKRNQLHKMMQHQQYFTIILQSTSERFIIYPNQRC